MKRSALRAKKALRKLNGNVYAAQAQQAAMQLAQSLAELSVWQARVESKNQREQVRACSSRGASHIS